MKEAHIEISVRSIRNYISQIKFTEVFNKENSVVRSLGKKKVRDILGKRKEQFPYFLPPT